MPRVIDTYLGLCAEVYDLSKPTPPEDAYNFYRDYARKAKGPILEPMCGTGRFLLPLIEGGFDVHGFDASHYMLAKLYEKAKAKNLKTKVWQGLAQDLVESQKYDLIFIPSGSFCLMANESEAIASLKAFYNHLTETGILLLEVETPVAIPQLGNWRDSLWPKPDGKKILLSQLATLDRDVCKVLGRYELILDNKIIQTEIEEYKIRVYAQDVLVNMIKSVGFNNIHLIKAFSATEKPSETDESVVYECRR
jgi:SAM-dependent methyltransferase